MKQLPVLLLTLIVFPLISSASNIIEVVPIHHNLLMVHFDDGEVIHHQKGEPRENDVVNIVPLDLSLATSAASYTIFSTDDLAYDTAQSPVQVFRKSKGTEFAWHCDDWDNGCINTNPDHALEHWIYLRLDLPLQTGKTYTLRFDGLAENADEWKIIFDENNLRSEAIHVNQLGYAPASTAKYGYLYHWAGDLGGVDFSAWDSTDFYLWRTWDESIAFTGKVKFRRSKNYPETSQQQDTPNRNFAGSDIFECDFSACQEEGPYRLVIPGIGCSFDFWIIDSVYNQAFLASVRSLFHNHSGVALTTPYTSHTRPAPHNPTTTPGFTYRLFYSKFRALDMSTLDGAEADKAPIELATLGNLSGTWGWYQNGGDWDAYFAHSEIPQWLLMLFEENPWKFGDGSFGIPESGNQSYDLLDEAMWLPDFYFRAKKEITDKGWGTGGVPGARVFGDLWGDNLAPDGTARGSWEDNTRNWYVLGEDPWTTYRYAGIAAQLAWFKEHDVKVKGNINWRKEAIDAWNWAQNNTKSGDEAEKLGVTLAHQRMYAAVLLYRLTSENKYHQQFIADAEQQFPQTNSVLSSGDLQLAAFYYAKLDSSITNSIIQDRAQTLVYASADTDMQTADARGTRWGGNYTTPMLAGQATTPIIQTGILGYYLAKKEQNWREEKLLRNIQTTADYFLGNNPLNMCWVSGVGDRYPTGIFHPDWWYGPTSSVLPGIAPFGPWRNADYGPLNPLNPLWPTKTFYPDYAQWPGHEQWTNTRITPRLSDFNVHQTSRWNILTYGVLASPMILLGTDDPLSTNYPDWSLTAWYNVRNRTITLNNPDSKSISLIQLYNTTGQMVSQCSYTQTDAQTLLIQVPVIPAGIYLLKVTGADGQQKTLKILL